MKNFGVASIIFVFTIQSYAADNTFAIKALQTLKMVFHLDPKPNGTNPNFLEANKSYVGTFQTQGDCKLVLRYSASQNEASLQLSLQAGNDFVNWQSEIIPVSNNPNRVIVTSYKTDGQLTKSFPA